MGRIRRLPSELSNQIAAGEVVERPASVIKELVENAIDAGARRVAVTIEIGGKKLIRVDDDGVGMDADDAQLAIERHATSKIRSSTDLDGIRTLGFRGEALPSIASVSRFRLRTRARGEASGTEVRVEGGQNPTVKEVGAPEGTSIEVAELFYNLPARRKFLKSDSAESAQVSKLVTQLALCYPEIGFSLTSAGRKAIEWPPAASLADRFFQVHGDRADLVPIAKEAGGIQIEGFIAALGDQGPLRGQQNVFINRRIVRDKTVQHAIVQAYSVATIKERSPEVHLFISIAPERIDVNVHPTKAEVRFLEQSLVHEVLRRAIGEALGVNAQAPELTLAAPMMTPGVPSTSPLPGLWGGHTTPQRTAGWNYPDRPYPAPSENPSNDGTEPVERSEPTEPMEPIGRTPTTPMIPLGQFRNTFILCVDEEGIAIVDQHVAHERILFEQISERLSAGTLESQRLLAPIVLELSSSQSEALGGQRDELARLGFEAEPFGGTSLRIDAVPALLDLGEAEATIRALADDLEGLEQGSRAGEAIRRMAATMACHAAVKANDMLTMEKMRYILAELERTSYSSVCPHGRPVVLRLTRREIEKNFQRI
ncbi:MAG: DNA mismatch repair endonuclease MutL [Acidobacteriota bacterium]|nr:DNA mismatch repair endonuclease MutL [Acidobacteriota bacterium]